MLNIINEVITIGEIEAISVTTGKAMGGIAGETVY
jgi:hypothetical protein